MLALTLHCNNCGKKLSESKIHLAKQAGYVILNIHEDYDKSISKECYDKSKECCEDLVKCERCGSLLCMYYSDMPH